MSHQIQKNWQYTSSQGCMGTASSSSTSTTVKKEPGTLLPFNSTAWTNDQSQLMYEGKCFNCYEWGHLSINYPKKQKSDLKELKQLTEQNQKTQDDSENA